MSGGAAGLPYNVLAQDALDVCALRPSNPVSAPIRRAAPARPAYEPTIRETEPMNRENTAPGAPARPEATHEDRPAFAAALMIGSLALISLQDGLVKILSAHVSIWQFQVLRAGLILIGLSLAAWLIAGPVPRPKSPRAVLVRSLFLAASMFFFFGGAPFLPLSHMAAGLYTFPLFTSLLGWLLLGERVGPRRIVAIVMGFAGTLLIVQPWRETFEWAALMPVAAGLCYAGSVITTRRYCRAESPWLLAYAVNITYVISGLAGTLAVATFAPAAWASTWPYLFGGWQALTVLTAGLVALAAMLNLAANVGLARAYQSAEPSWLAPFDYSYLALSAAWGVILFGTVPGPMVLAGMTLIALAGSFVAWRERQENRARQANAHRSLR